MQLNATLAADNAAGCRRSCRMPVSAGTRSARDAGHPAACKQDLPHGPAHLKNLWKARRLGMNVNRRLVSAAIATAAAALFATGVVSTATAQEVKVKCYGANACKGKSECKTSMSGCKGKNACKGQGFEQMTEKACVDKLGRA
jgi:hypothetical protein